MKRFIPDDLANFDYDYENDYDSKNYSDYNYDFKKND